MNLPKPPLRRKWVTALWLFATFTAFYLGTARGYFSFGDDSIMFQVTQNIVDNHRLDAPVRYFGPTSPLQHSKYGIGLSLVAAPFYLVAGPVTGFLGLPGLSPSGADGFLVVAVLVVSPLVTALTVAGLYLLLENLAFDRLVAVATAALYGISTMAWHYSRTFLSEPLVGFTLLGSILFLRKAELGKREVRWLVMSGALFGLTVATRVANLPLVVVLLAYLLWQRRQDRRRALSSLALWLLPVCLWLALVGWYDWMRFGTILETGYRGEAGAFTTPILTGLYGLLLSPGKGLLAYNPILLLAILGAPALLRRDRALTAMIGAVFLAYLGVYSRFYSWYGGGAWGPRFLVPVVPLLMLAVAPCLARRPRGWTLPVIVALAAASIVVQVGSVAISYVDYLIYIGGQSTPKLLFEPRDSAIVGHLRFLLSGHPLDFAFLHYAFSRQYAILLAAIQIPLLLMSIGLGAVGAISLIGSRYHGESRSSIL